MSEKRSAADLWPYDWRATEAHLDPQKIVEHGRFFLSRALNTRSVAAFLGSGVSIAYGRASWTQVTMAQLELVIDYLGEMEKKLKKEVEGAELKKRFQLPAPLGTLKVNLKSLQTSLVGKLETNQLMLAHQLCEQVWSSVSTDTHSGVDRKSSQLKELSTRAGVEAEYSKAVDARMRQPDIGSHLFRACVKDETFDELRFVIRILNGSLDDKAIGATTRACLHKDWKRVCKRIPVFGDLIGSEGRRSSETAVSSRKRSDLVSSKPRESKHLRIFSRENARELVSLLHERISDPAVRAALQTLRRSLSSDPNRRDDLLEPTQYFVVGLLLDLARALFRQNGGKSDGLPEEIEERLKPPKRATPVSRSSMIDKELDPLRIMDAELKIRRFATTNWDIEIERYFSDVGFRNHLRVEGEPSERATTRVSPLSDRAREIVVDAQSGTDFLDFAANEYGGGYQVAHLHGRATEDSNIVATERDYQETYVRHSTRHTIVREGVQALFGGNPILFVGLGMAEDDLMRPLRQFLTEDLRRNRWLFALVNATDTREDCAAWAMTMFARYGVHVDYFGEWRGSMHPARARSEQPERWIYLANCYRHALRRALLNKKEKRENIREEDLLESKSHRDQWVQIRKQALGKDRFKSDEEECDVALEFASLSLIREIAGRIDEIFPNMKIKNRLLERVLPDAADHAYSSMVTAALCAKLKVVGTGWRNWWERWRRTPAGRGDQVAFGSQKLLSRGRLADRGYHNDIWTRHQVKDHLPDSSDAGGLSDAHGAGLFFESVKVVNARMQRPTRLGRRVFVVSAEAGAGKGAFFYSLSSPQTGVANAVEADRLLAGLSLPQRYVGRFFVSFSFSGEVTSVLDALIAFLFAPRSAHQPRYALRIACRKTGLDPGRLGRIGMLREGFARLAATLDDSFKSDGDRVLIALNCVDILLDQDGYPKNGELAAIFDLLLGADAADAPFDLILVTRDAPFPIRFRNDEAARDVRARRDLEAHEHETLALLFEPSVIGANAQAAASNRRVVEELKRAYDFINRTAASCSVGPCADADFDFRCLPLPRSCALREDLARDSFAPAFLHILVPFDPSSAGRDTRLSAEKALSEWTDRDFSDIAESRERWEREPASRQQCEQELRDRQRGLFELLKRRRFLFTVYVRIITEILKEEPDKSRALAEIDAFCARCRHAITASQRNVHDRALAFALQWWFERDCNDLKKVARRTRALLGQALMRHLSVLAVPVEADVFEVCPEICEIGRQIEIARQGEIEGEEKSLTTEVKESLESLVNRGLVFRIVNRHDHPERAGDPEGQPDRKDRYVVHRAIRHFFGRRLSARNIGSAASNQFSVSLYAANNPELPHLSASGYKFLHDLVSALVDYPDDLESSQRPPGQAARCLRAAVGVLRCMFSIGVVFRFSELSRSGPATLVQPGYLERHRYILRWMLHYAVHLEDGPNLAIPRRCFDEIWLLLSELADEPPRKRGGLTLQDRERLRALLDVLRRRLSMLEGNDVRPSGGNPSTRNQAHAIKQKINTIKGLLGEQNPAPRKLPATWVHPVDDKGFDTILRGLNDDIRRLRKEGYDWEPFYRDEVLWLVNECGVFSYAQGHIYDAHAHFETALGLCRKLEGESGPMTRRVQLNYALAEIDRGNIREGRRMFEEIEARSHRSDVIIRHIAHGCRFLAGRLLADLHTVIRDIDKPIEGLIGMNRPRAAALLSLTSAYAFEDLRDHEGARKELSRTIELAMQSASEDFVRMARVAEARMCVREAKAKAEDQARTWLDEAEEYAQRMEMPRLLADVLITRVEAQLQVGERASAGDLCARALRVTSLYGMRLKKLETLELMCRVNAQRGEREAAKRLRSRVLRAAQDIGFLLLLERAERTQHLFD